MRRQRVAEPRQFLRRQHPLAFPLGELLDMAAGVRPSGRKPQRSARLNILDRRRARGSPGRARARRMVQLRDIGTRHLRDLPLAERRQDDLVEQPLVLGRGAALALCLGMFSNEPLGEFGDGRRFLAGDFIGRGIGAVLDPS